MKFLRYQRVRYTGPRFPDLEQGAEGFVSDANNALSVTTRYDETIVEFPGAVQRRKAIREDWLEAL